MSFKNIAITGILYTSFGSVIGQVFQFITKIVLARLLVPEDFGLMALILSITNIVSVFFNLGWSSELIQRKKKIKDAFNTTGTFFLVISVLFTTILFFSSYHLAYFLEKPVINSLIKVFSLIFVFNAFNSLYNTYVEKYLMFKKKIFCDVNSIIVFSLISIILAYFGFGVWSLLIAQLLQAFSLSLFLLLSTGWLPSFNFNFSLLRNIWSFVKHTSLVQIFTILILNLDYLFVGLFLGSENLGFYSIAFALSSIPVIIVAHSIGGVMFPIFSRVRNKEELKKFFLKSSYLNFVLLLPIIIIGIIIADYSVLFLSNKWTSITSILRVLLVYSLFRSIFSIISSLILSINKPNILKKIFFIEFFFLLILIVPSIKLFGLFGAVFAVLFSRVVATLISIIYINRYLSISSIHYSKILKILMNYVIIGLLIYIIKLKLLMSIDIMNFIIIILLSFTLYLLSSYLFDKDFAREIDYLVKLFSKQ